VNDRHLRSKLIRLAHANPHLRADILPLLTPRGKKADAGKVKAKAYFVSSGKPTVALELVSVYDTPKHGQSLTAAYRGMADLSSLHKQRIEKAKAELLKKADDLAEPPSSVKATYSDPSVSFGPSMALITTTLAISFDFPYSKDETGQFMNLLTSAVQSGDFSLYPGSIMR